VRRVVVLDDNVAPGGQIFRRYGAGFAVHDAHAAGREYSDGERLINEARQSGAEIRSGVTVWGAWDGRVAYATDAGSGSIEGEALVVASGARDRPVAFPGWTLPGVITAGAAKTMVAIQRVLPGRRILMAGSGPLALAFSAQLRSYGANMVEVAEAAPRPNLGALARLAAAGDPATLREALQYRLKLLRDRVPLTYGTIIVRVLGQTEVTGAVLARADVDWRPVPGTERTVEVDTVVLGYGLEASNEFFRLVGCELRFVRDLGGWIPVKDERMRTSLPFLYAAGDGSGIGGARFAMAEGRIAGIAAAAGVGLLDDAEAERRMAPYRRRLARLARFRDALNAVYRVGAGLYELADPQTVICRCEERTEAELEALIREGIADPNIVRARSRIGMGRCQGRNCASHVGAAIARLHNLPVEAVPPLSARPPLRPVGIAAIAEEREQHDAAVEVL
jgi:thioredoxin reductase